MPPLHPFFVHFPIALLTLGFIADVVAVIRRLSAAGTLGWWNLLAGTVGLIITVASGLISKANAEALSGRAAETLSTHEQLAFACLTGFLVLIFWRIANKTAIPPTSPRVYLGLAGVCLILLWCTAWFGGELVYLFGIGVIAPPAP